MVIRELKPKLHNLKSSSMVTQYHLFLVSFHRPQTSVDPPSTVEQTYHFQVSISILVSLQEYCNKINVRFWKYPTYNRTSMVKKSYLLECTFLQKKMRWVVVFQSRNFLVFSLKKFNISLPKGGKVVQRPFGRLPKNHFDS